MTGMLFSEPNKRKPYRPKAYRSKFALENTDPAEEGLSGGEFDGDLTNDPLKDLEVHPWMVEPGAEEVVNQDEDFEREEDTLTNKTASSRHAYKGFPYDDLHNQPFIPGHKWPTYLYRGLAIKVPSDVEGELDFAMMDGDQQGVFQVGRKILDIIGRSGIGRHWTTEPDVAMDFANTNKSNGNIVVVLSALWERDGEDFAAEHEGYDGVVRPSRLVGEEEVTLKPGTRIKLLSMKGSRVLNGSLMERNFDIEFLSSPEMRTASQLVANDGVLDSLNPTGGVFVDYDPESRASMELAPNIRPYSEVNGVDPDERMVVYRGVPPGVQTELADGDFITDMEQLAKDYAGYPYGEVISQEVFADEILDSMDEPGANEYLFRPRRASKKTAEDYFMEHRPAGPDFGSPLHDLNDTFPDIYDSPHYYDFGEPGNKDSFTSIQRAKGNPEEMVTMYRSIPSDGTPSFAPGDWVSTSGEYARSHSLSENEEDDDFIVMEQQVPASSLWSEGNSVAEWGFHGEAMDGIISEQYTPKKTLERLRSQKNSGLIQPTPVFSGDDSFHLGRTNSELSGEFGEIGSFGSDSSHFTDSLRGHLGSAGRFSSVGGSGGESVPLVGKSVPDSEVSWVDTPSVIANDRVMENQVPFIEGANVDDVRDPTGSKLSFLEGEDGVSVPVESSSLPFPAANPRRLSGHVPPETLFESESFGSGSSVTRRGHNSPFDVGHRTPHSDYQRAASRTANSEFPALPKDFVSNISPDGFDSRWTYETTGYEPRSSDDRYELSINPVNSPAVIPGEENGLRKKPIFYDPERTELEWDDLFGHSPTRQDRDLSHLSPPEGLLWRGMSNEEYESAKQDGYFQSKGDWNFEGQEGETYFSTNPDAAANYTNDFAPIQFKPGFGNPAHVIGIPDRPDLPRNDHEVGVPGQIPFSDVVHHYTGYPTAISPGSSSYFNDTWTGEWSEGGGSGPSVSLAWEPGEGYEPKTSRRVAGTEDRPGNIYRGIASDFLTDDEYSQIVDWSRQNEFDPDNFQLAEPNYEMIYPILERLEEKNGLGRHWSTDYDVANDFASQSAWHYDENNDRDEDDPDYRSPFGIIFRGDWGGEGVDYAEQHRGHDGVTRPSNLEHEKEVTLHPGSEVNLLGIDILGPEGFSYDIPVPDIPIYSKKRVAQRKRENMSAINGYLRYANLRGLDPNDSRTSRSYRRASRNLSPKSMVEISNWMKAQKTAHNTADQVLATTRSYRHKISSSWHLDNKLNAYISKVQQKFACSCGSKLAVPSYTNCKCGKVWNAYKIHSATKGDTVFVVREVPVRENVLVANKTASRHSRANEETHFVHDNGVVEVFDANAYLREHPNADIVTDGYDGRMWDDSVATGWTPTPGGRSPFEYDRYSSRRRRPPRSRRVANDYDTWDDTYDFLDHAKGRGYTMPKDMGDPDSGTFQDELWDYTRGDRSRMERITDTARGNWGDLRHSRRTRRGRR